MAIVIRRSRRRGGTAARGRPHAAQGRAQSLSFEAATLRSRGEAGVDKI
jgi:hypothetical protein